MRIKGGGLQIPDRLGQRLAGAVVRQRRDTLGGKAQIKDHEDLLVFGQSKCLCQLVGVKKVQPAAVHTGVGGASIRCVATMDASSTPESRLPPGYVKTLLRSKATTRQVGAP